MSINRTLQDKSFTGFSVTFKNVKDPEAKNFGNHWVTYVPLGVISLEVSFDIGEVVLYFEWDHIEQIPGLEKKKKPKLA